MDNSCSCSDQSGLLDQESQIDISLTSSRTLSRRSEIISSSSSGSIIASFSNDNDMSSKSNQSVDATTDKNKQSKGTKNSNRKFNRMFQNLKRRKRYQRVTNEDKQIWSLWNCYCFLLTFWIPSILLEKCGLKGKERQWAWKEKIGLLSVIAYLGIMVTFLTFGFSKTICKQDISRINIDDIDNSKIIINGNVYPFEPSYIDQNNTDIYINESTKIFQGPSKYGGTDLTFLFQNVNGNCHDTILPKQNSTILHDEIGQLGWYFPCNVVNGTYLLNDLWNCNLDASIRQEYYDIESFSEVFYTWEQIANHPNNLVVYNGAVLDLTRISWFERDQLEIPPLFNHLLDANLKGYDISLVLGNKMEKNMMKCLLETIKVGKIDSQTVGCITSDVVLYLSLIFILAIVFAKFFIACYFRWFIAVKQGATKLNEKSWRKHQNEIEEWSKNMQAKAQIKNVDKSLRPKYSQKFRSEAMKFMRRSSKIFSLDANPLKLNSGLLKDNNTEDTKFQNDSTSIKTFPRNIIDSNIVQQPPETYQPFGFPLLHTICFVTCYSEGRDSLRVTLDSISTTDYLNSHKLLFIVCDGLIKGSENDELTSDIIIDMMYDFVIPPEEVKPSSYISIASGAKRHNKAKLYAGYYKYDDELIPYEKQQRIPMIAVVKCGTEVEQLTAKPGNRGKRDSQVILMSFLQKVTYEERMTELEYNILRNLWQITGLTASKYEAVLMVDADTKVFPDSLTHMVAEFAKDPMVMGLCGETKIANKKETWVTAIQVFEYYISHHQVKAFESVFNSVTCLPGCFSIYRIKAPKGREGFWIPILCNPEIVTQYSNNNVKSLHQKNLLLLGEDRYLSSLLLKTFPKRKQIFVPKAACKTIVPSELKVLLSQRRRWINSTVHNLFELILIRDLCGTFCFSMQFIIMIELIGTLVLPLAITFTLYVIYFSIFSNPTPVITLILLAIILGLPAVFVVLTTISWSYIIWMLIYIIALPVWNFVLPTYAFWKFDDFSWGNTRTIIEVKSVEEQSDEKPQHLTEDNNQFNYSEIKLNYWQIFEKERNYK